MKKRMMRCMLQVVVNNQVTSCSIHGSSGGSDTTRRVGTRRARLFRLLLSSSPLLFPLSVSLSPSLSLCLLFSRQSTPVPIRPPIRQNVIINVQLINQSIHPSIHPFIHSIKTSYGLFGEFIQEDSPRCRCIMTEAKRACRWGQD